MNFIDNYVSIISSSIKKYNNEDFKIARDIILSKKNTNNKVIIFGNGGSAAMSSHVSVDFTKVAKIRSINFNEADLITCFANDY